MAHSKQLWDEAKKRCKLSEQDICIAKEMGLNPKSLIKNIPSKQQAWKLPVNIWLQSMWEERQDKAKRKQEKKQTALNS
jgi:hypothetical protein